MELEWWMAPLLALVGAIAGIINVLAGGGSLLTLPCMIAMGIPSTMANGTNRVAIIAQNMSAVAGFRRQGWSNAGLSLKLGLCALPGSLIGAWYGAIIRDDIFNLILAGVMLLIFAINLRKRLSGRTAMTGAHEQAADAAPARPLLGYLSMAALGFYGGFIQAGVGFMLIPSLALALGPGLVRVNMHKVLIVLIYTTAALGIFIWKDKVLWLPALCLAAGNALGGWIGAHLAVGKGDRLIAIVFDIALLALVTKLLWPWIT